MVAEPQLKKAVNFALMSTGAAAAALPPPQAVAQDMEVEQIVVTGSRIRRVDNETASPVFTLDQSAIAESGSTTIGDLLQQIPSVSGAATNPQVNNGGGDGASTIELRGLGSQRTLILLNGRRLGALGPANQGANVNVIPTNLVERVEVLKEGAGAIYGTDAVGGVVNFITRDDVDGLELGYEYGVSGRGDGDVETAYIAWGNHTDRSNIIVSGTYQTQDEISANDRRFTREAIYFYTYVFAGGSSRTPTGRIFLPASPDNVAKYGCEPSGGNISVTRIAGASGASPNDFRCFTGDDAYNYQPWNLVLTPQERGSIFTEANYEINEYATVYAEYLYNYTSSGFQIAPLPFDSRSDTIVIPGSNVFNPFDIDFGASGDSTYQQAMWRLEGLGTRHSKTDTSTDQITLGMKGKTGLGNWDWDLYGSYGSVDQDSKVDGYLFRPLLQPAFGPNFIAPGGQVVCGTPTNPIAGCVPINPFNLESEQSVTALRALGAAYTSNYSFTQKIASLTFNGDVMNLPAGALAAAVGYEYMDQYARYDTDFNTEAQPPYYNVCQLSNETCSGDSEGSTTVNAFYAEAFIPVLKDVPGAYALNLILGVRYSDYDEFGGSTDGTYKLEWRPIADMLVRASYADVFRVPTVYDLYHAPASNSPTFNDPCVGLTQADVNANPNLALACVNVPRDGSFSQPNSQIDGLRLSDSTLKPETGDVLTAGVVYDPSWLSGLSMSADYWDYSLINVITEIDPNTAAEQCVLTGEDQFCGLFTRFDDGTIFQARQTTSNFGKLDTSGWDFSVKYLWRGTAVGDFRFSVDATYISEYQSTVYPGTAPINVEGTYDRQYGNYAKWRGIAGIGWSLNPFTALITARYVDGIKLLDPDGQPGIQPPLDIASKTYVDLGFSYTFDEKLTARVTVDNVFNEGPPMMYMNNVLNSNTDVSTYDLIGTFYRMSLAYKF